MAEFEEKLQSILGNPELMGQIMSMAGAMNQPPPPPPPPQQPTGMPFDPSAMAGNLNQPSPPPPPKQSAMPFDPGAMAHMMQMLQATQLEPRQRNLIQALRGFVPDDRLIRLEKAMQASLIAKFAAAAMNQGGRHV